MFYLGKVGAWLEGYEACQPADEVGWEWMYRVSLHANVAHWPL